jgi:hypothetical protein
MYIPVMRKMLDNKNIVRIAILCNFCVRFAEYNQIQIISWQNVRIVILLMWYSESFIRFDGVSVSLEWEGIMVFATSQTLFHVN